MNESKGTERERMEKERELDLMPDLFPKSICLIFIYCVFLILMRIEAEKKFPHLFLSSFILFFHPSSKLLLLMIIHYPIILKFFPFSL